MIWLELYRWKWLGIRTLELDENYNGNHRSDLLASKFIVIFCL